MRMMHDKGFPCREVPCLKVLQEVKGAEESRGGRLNGGACRQPVVTTFVSIILCRFESIKCCLLLFLLLALRFQAAA